MDTIDKYYYHDWVVGEEDDGFTLNDMMRPLLNDENNLLVFSPPKLPIISKQNYEKLTSWFAVCVPTQSHINMATIEGLLTLLCITKLFFEQVADELECPEQRKPLHQFLIGIVCHNT